MTEPPAPPSDRLGALSALPWQLDLVCPIALPSRQVEHEVGWPVQRRLHISSHEQGSASLEAEIDAVHLAAVLLPEDLLPLSHIASDLISILGSASPSQSVHSISDIVRSIPEIEAKYRRKWLPVIMALSLSETGSLAEVRQARIEDAIKSADMTTLEAEALKSALDLRMGCRKVQDGEAFIVARKLAEELEQRDVMLQVVLLMILLPIRQTPGYVDDAPNATVDPGRPSERTKKRRRKNRESLTEGETVKPIRPSDDPEQGLESLFDRIAVWMTMAELDLGLGEEVERDHSAGGKKGISQLVKRFWKDVLHPLFINTLPKQCGLFHLKVFNTPFLPQSTKKPRKPQLTRAKPSSDDITAAIPRVNTDKHPSRLVPPAPERALSRSQSQSSHVQAPINRLQSRSSRGPSESRSLIRASSRRSSPGAVSQNGSFATGVDMRRSTSHTSLNGRVRSRSRSISVDVSLADRDQALVESLSQSQPSKRASGTSGSTALMRQPSGKDLFKGRQVGLLRRSASGATRRVSLEKEKPGEPASQRDQSETVPQSQPKGLFGRTLSKPARQDSSNMDSETLVMATPARPRHYAFDERQRPSNAYEAQVQAKWDDYHRRYAHYTPIAEEPASKRPDRVAETPMGNRIAYALDFGDKRDSIETVMDDDDDGLGDLMVPTDDEDEGDVPSAAWAGVPETPAR